LSERMFNAELYRERDSYQNETLESVTFVRLHV